MANIQNRKQVILHNRNGWHEDKNLALTDDQIRLLKWLASQELFNEDDWDIQILGDAISWVEI